MIEQAMFFALGFLVMGLLGLLFLPFYWHRAVRLSTQRLESQMPLSMAEVMAERDGLRAEFATQTRRIEQKAEAAVSARISDRVELGRRAGQISALQASLATVTARAAELDAACTAALRARAEAEAGLSAGLVEIHDANGLAAKVQGAYRELTRAHQDLRQQTDSQRTTIAALDTRASGLEIRLDDARHALDSATAARLAQDETVRQLERDLTAMRSRLAELGHQHATLIDDQAAAKHETATMAARLTAESARSAQARADHSGETARAALAGNELAEALRREKDLRASLQRQMDMARASDANLARRIETLRAENEGLRAEAETLKSQAAATDRRARQAVSGDTVGEEDIALLRAAIADIGRDMTRLNRALEQDSGAAMPPAERLRQLQAHAGLDALGG